ncbi:hypothetical protein PRIPAC_75305, partial [Pristionchus pacificus]|uniref:Uncharacterized protein n=1 Tax=Pristionchus pacificus TaxID=54126 RepID=A0A2A6C514_PRIPA
YEAVCDRVGQWLAQPKNLNSLKQCDLGFSRVLMTMGILIFRIEPSLAPDDVTLSWDVRKRGKTDVDVTSPGANEGSIRKINNMPIIISTLEHPKSRCFRKLRFLSCAKLVQICPILRLTASYDQTSNAEVEKETGRFL